MKKIAMIVASPILLALGSCECEEAVGKWALPKERLHNADALQDQGLKKSVESLVFREWPGSKIDLWNDRGVSWDVRVAYLKVTMKNEVKMICVSYSGQTDESKVEKDLFLSEGIASQAKITKEEARKLITSFSSVPEVAGYLPAFFYLPGEGEDERESEDLPPGTWGYVIGEKEVIDRKKGLAQAEVYLTKEFKVIGHKITGSIE